ncbi:hypothetical protein ACFL4L_04735 [bacterium]
MNIKKIIWARSAEQFELAQNEVTLDISEEEDLIEFFVNGPFRDKNNHIHWHGGRYCVTYHFSIKVPFKTDLDLETVNDGSIKIAEIKGRCSANNINGGIEATGIHEVNKIYALNEDVLIHFNKNPTQDCIVGSLNGDVRLYFNPNLSADFIIKTFNGEVYSDFEVERIDGEAYVTINKRDKHHYKNRSS